MSTSSRASASRTWRILGGVPVASLLVEGVVTAARQRQDAGGPPTRRHRGASRAACYPILGPLSRRRRFHTTAAAITASVPITIQATLDHAGSRMNRPSASPNQMIAERDEANRVGVVDVAKLGGGGEREVRVPCL